LRAAEDGVAAFAVENDVGMLARGPSHQEVGDRKWVADGVVEHSHRLHQVVPDSRGWKLYDVVLGTTVAGDHVRKGELVGIGWPEVDGVRMDRPGGIAGGDGSNQAAVEAAGKVDTDRAAGGQAG